ncbi:MAG: ATP-dependent helicase, RecQ family [Deltaproteobacteria bacterium]|nr:ATP-dependent helicase, RecQ family [Deltaproteobacteria bacterium]
MVAPPRVVASPRADEDARLKATKATTKAPRGAKKLVAPVPEAPPRPIYTLEGPIPPEGEGLPKKVGALLAVAQKALGIKSFRPGQAEAFEHLLNGEDLLAVMPTGSGKSLLYQLTSLVVPGVTVVVSPLIALIKDQIDKMVAKGVTAVRIDSTLTVKQRREVDALIRSPGGKLLLTTPERMADPEFRVFLREACGGIGVSRFVVDEAHCVSQWGHDFRPAYLSLRKALEDVGRPPVLATTATAPPHVREDILFQLGIEKATIVTTTFDRPNLHYEVIIFSDEDEKLKTLVTLLKKLPRPGIVYCATVKKVEELYEALTRWGVPTAKYHGRMNKNERTDSQQRFMDSSDLIMVATNAFGLGVDKSNIRNVLHYHVPGSLEAYAQEAGRGGRDGKPARCVLLFSPDDVAIQEYFLSGTYPTKRQVRQVYEALEAFTALSKSTTDGTSRRLAEDSPPTVANLALSSGVGQQRTRTVLSLLKDEHFITEREGGLYYVADPAPEFELIMERAKQYEARRIADRMRLDSLLAYVKAPGCRSQVILDYLGEPDPPKCGRCDNCLRSREAALAASTEATRLGASLTRQLDDDSLELPKPRREIKARVVRIDQPQPELAATDAAAIPAKPATTVLRRSGRAEPTPPPAAAPTVMRRSSAPPPVTNGTAIGVAPVALRPDIVSVPGEQPNGDELDDDELDDDELALDGDDDDLDDDDDDDDDLDDDDDDDDDDYEVIDRTAAEIAEEGVEGPGEITVLARKRIPKVAKVRPARPDETPSANAAEARRRRRRRRRKRRAMLPPKSAFTTPVLSTGEPLSDAQPRRQNGGGGGPVIEYVRGPMRIAMAPVASANPNDAGVGRRRGGPGGGGRLGRSGGGSAGRRWERGPGGGGGGGGAGFERRNGGRTDGPRIDRSGPRPDGPAAAAQPLDANGVPRKRRRRRRKRGGNGMPMQQAQGGATGTPEAPVAFFSPVGGANTSEAAGDGGQGPVALGPDGQPLRKRRRRRRRGRGGRQREWHAGAAGEAGGPPPGDSAGGGGDGESDAFDQESGSDE